MNRILAMSLFLLLLLTSCIPPLSKESYLSQYEGFILKTRENRNTQGFSWEKNYKEFEKFSQGYYKRFEDQLNRPEKVLCKRLQLEYLLMRTHDELRSTIKNVFYNDIKKMQDRIENYIENDLTHDFSSLMKEVENVTSLTFDALKKALGKAKIDGSSTSH